MGDNGEGAPWRRVFMLHLRCGGTGLCCFKVADGI
ncbi:hypothetical protein DAI22_11g165201 [Oryza sativa Japonica Group]|nr:hypothetical protein DAI22_11g165201 [Oryza sativa Japonica Group]